MTHRQSYKYYDLVMAVFVTVLLCSNLIGPAKIWTFTFPDFGFGSFHFDAGAGILFFPISYLFGDFLTEVYGYARARKVVWAGFGALAFASFMAWTVVNLPAAAGWSGQEAIASVFGSTWRIVAASITAYWVGEFANSFVLAKMKILTEGRWLFTRTIGSTIVGAGLDSLVFYPVAFWGVWSNNQVISVMIANYILKVLWEVIATPFTYWFVAFLKRVEHEDYYDRKTNFTPFSLET